MIQARITLMSGDAKRLHKLVKERQDHIEGMEEKKRNEKEERVSSLAQIRESQSILRQKKNDAKEQERTTLSRTLMTKFVTSADYPDCPPFVPHLINMLKNIIGTFF